MAEVVTDPTEAAVLREAMVRALRPPPPNNRILRARANLIAGRLRAAIRTGDWTPNITDIR